jgi:hypothetical protein
MNLLATYRNSGFEALADGVMAFYERRVDLRKGSRRKLHVHHRTDHLGDAAQHLLCTAVAHDCYAPRWRVAALIARSPGISYLRASAPATIV